MEYLSVLVGAVNGDGTIDLKDIIAVLQVNTGLDVEVNSNADINNDRKIGIPEAIDNLSTLSAHYYLIKKMTNTTFQLNKKN